MEESTAEKLSRIIREKDLNVKSNRVKHLKIFDMKDEEYDRFITYLKTEVPSNQGNDGVMLLLDVFDRYKVADKLIAKLEQEISELKNKLNEQPEEKPKRKVIGSD